MPLLWLHALVHVYFRWEPLGVDPFCANHCSLNVTGDEEKGGIRSALRFQSTADSNERDKQFPSFLYELEGGQRQSPRCLELTQGLAELMARSYLKLRAFFFFLRHWKMAAHEGGANLGFTWHVHRPLPLHWVSHSSFEEHCVPEHSTHKIHDLARGCKRRR